ncbi:MAG: hypothetical protein L0Z54_04055 [Thermoplasmata archaeon]|nr:hypothetical protein [Thermoplasmata archaeon]
MGRMAILMFMLVGIVLVAGLARGGDLQVNSIDFDPSKEDGIYAGQTLRVSATIRNNGTEKNSSALEFYMDATLIATRQAEQMNPGQTIVFQVDYHSKKADSGNHDFRAVLTAEDDRNNNNEKTDTYYIKQATPDLVPTSLDFDRDLIVDNYVRLTARIENQGTDSANTIGVKVMQDTETLTTESIGVLAEGVAKDVYLSFLLEESGTYDFTVQVDPSDAINEMDEENNQLTQQEDVAEPGPGDLADFDPVVIGWPETFAQGQSVTVYARIWNNGTRGYSDSDVNVTLMLDDVALAWTTASMPANFYDDVQFEWLISQAEGSYELIVSVDPLDEEDENDEDNNEDTLTIDVSAPLPKDHPDVSISVDDIDFYIGAEPLNESGSAVEEEEVQVRLIVRNLGNMTAANLTVTILLDGGLYLNQIVDITGAWNPPTQRTILIYWSAVRGEHTFGIWLDRNGTDEINETDEHGNARRENNYAERDINVVEGPLPDFYIDQAKIELRSDGSPVTSVEDNTTVYLSFEVANVGEVGGSMTVIVFDSSLPMPQEVSGTTIDRTSGELDVGEDMMIYVEWTLNSTGRHYIRAIAFNESDGDIDFSNNEAQVMVTVTGELLPDITLTDLRLNDSAPLRNSSVRIRFALHNLGDSAVTEAFIVLLTLVSDGEVPIGTVWNNWTIEENGTVNLSYDWALGTVKAGLYDIMAYADAARTGDPVWGRVREFDEGNNQNGTNITIRAIQAPDLELRANDIRVDPAWDPVNGAALPWANPVKRTDMAIISGRTMTLRVPVYNEGNTPMDQIRVNWSFRSLEEDTYNLKGGKTINTTMPLPAGSKTVVEFEIDVPARPETQLWELKASVVVLESGTTMEDLKNTRNNYYTGETWVIPDLPDPSIVSLSFSPQIPFANQDVAFAIGVANLGPVNFTEDLKLLVDGEAVKVNDDPLAENKKVLPLTLEPGERNTITILYAFAAEKTYTIRARMEVGNTQLNDANDFLETEIYVSPLLGTELRVSNVDIDETVYLNEEAIITISVRNDGSEGADVVTVRVSIEGRGILTERAISIAPLESETIDITWIPDEEGRFNLNVTVNPDRDVTEIDYTNNIYYVDAEQLEFPYFDVVQRPKETNPNEEDIPIMIVVGVVIASVAAGVGIFFLLRKS